MAENIEFENLLNESRNTIARSITALEGINNHTRMTFFEHPNADKKIEGNIKELTDLMNGITNVFEQLEIKNTKAIDAKV